MQAGRMINPPRFRIKFPLSLSYPDISHRPLNRFWDGFCFLLYECRRKGIYLMIGRQMYSRIFAGEIAVIPLLFGAVFLRQYPLVFSIDFYYISQIE